MENIELIQDTNFTTMWRLKYEDGELSDIYNITWAKEHKRRIEESEKRYQYPGRNLKG